MKAIIYDKKNKPDKLTITDIPKPSPDQNEVLVRIVAVSPNAADYRSLKMGIKPKKNIFGSAISGIVESVGSNIKNFKPGDEVIGELADYGFGGFAEYVVALEKALVHKPEKLSFQDASALPVAATTALKAVMKGNIQKSKKVLILGGSGGVGSYTIQLAKYFGADVTAVCSTKSIDQCTSIGADFVIDYTKTDLTKTNEKYDVIIAINGNYPLLACKRMLNSRGIYVMVGGAMPQIFKSIFFGWLLSLGTKKIRTISGKSTQKDLEFVAELAVKGDIKPVIENTYSLLETVDAMRHIGNGHVKGKLVITVSQPVG